MAITNPRAVSFSNEKIRTAADKLAQAYYTAKAVMQEYYAENLGELYTPLGDTIEDGSLTDGRKRITANDALLLITRCSDLVADMEANNNAKLNTVLKVSVNPTR